MLSCSLYDRKERDRARGIQLHPSQPLPTYAMIAKRAEPSEGSAVRLSSANALRSRPGPQITSINAERFRCVAITRRPRAGAAPRRRRPPRARGRGPKGCRGFRFFNALIDDDTVSGVLDIMTHGLQQLLTSSPHGPPRSKSLHWRCEGNVEGPRGRLPTRPCEILRRRACEARVPVAEQAIERISSNDDRWPSLLSVNRG
jgi:hypothetical protein